MIATIAVAGSAYAGGDPVAALKAITDYRTSELTKARTASTPIDMKAYNAKVTEVNAKVLQMAKDAIAGVSAETVEPSQGLDFAQLFQLAKMPKEACESAERFLSSKPGAMKSYQAQSIMLTSCNELGDGMMLMDLLQNVAPPSAMAVYSLATSTAYYYCETIKTSVGVDAAVAAIRLVEANVRLSAPANDQEKARMRASISLLAESKAELYADAKRKAEAVNVIDNALAELGEKSPEARSLNGFKKRMMMIDAAAPALAFEKSYGTFTGLEALKGKVVIVDFFAHWCGPCIASFEDMKKLYADLQPKGLEIIGFTTYYGYYKRENTEKRDMAKDVEFGKMGEFIKEYSLPWPVVYGDRSNFDAYGVTGIPHVAVIGRDGVVHKIKVGYSAASFAEFRKEIEALVGG